MTEPEHCLIHVFVYFIRIEYLISPKIGNFSRASKFMSLDSVEMDWNVEKGRLDEAALLLKNCWIIRFKAKKIMEFNLSCKEEGSLRRLYRHWKAYSRFMTNMSNFDGCDNF